MRRGTAIIGTSILAAFALAAGCQQHKQEPSRAAAPSSPVENAATEKSTDTSSAAESTPAEKAQPAQDQRAKRASESTTDAEGWGSLRGRFVFVGARPEPKELQITSDIEYCSMHHPRDESLLVNAEGSGLANVVVMLFRTRTEPTPRVHPSYAETAAAKVSLDNQKCRFRPHVLAMRTSQTLEVLNTDDVAHNTKIDTLSNPATNPTLPSGGKLEQKYSLEERSPVRIGCSIHPWMAAWLIVRDDPYVAVTDSLGTFTIANVPAGKRTFQVWHERARYITAVQQNGAPVQWNRGLFVAEIKNGETTDIGEIRVDRSLFGAN